MANCQMLNSKTIVVAMSGGVDSSTVAAMLREQGYNVVGLTMQLWNQRRLAGHHGMPSQPVQGRCCSLDDVYDARRVAEQVGIPYYVVNFEQQFEAQVVRPFVEGPTWARSKGEWLTKKSSARAAPSASRRPGRPFSG